MSQAVRVTNSEQRGIGDKVLVSLVLLLVLSGAYRGLHHTHAAAEKPAASAAVPLVASADTKLSQIITSWAGQQHFSSSVVVRELTGSKRTASYKSATSTVTASTYKIYVAYGVLHEIEQGSYALTTRTADGNTVQTDLNNMIVNSDNTAGRTLGFLTGWRSLDALLKTQGATATNLNNYVGNGTAPVGDKYTTAADLTVVLNKLYAGTLLNAPHTQLLLGLMEKQAYRERIPAGVPKGVVVADKPGWLTDGDDGNTVVENDAAIVYGPKSTYILVITTTGDTTQPLANLSRQIYTYLET